MFLPSLNVLRYYLEVHLLLSKQAHRVQHAQPAFDLSQEASSDYDHFQVEASQSSVGSTYELAWPFYSPVVHASAPEKTQSHDPAAPAQLLRRLDDPVDTPANAAAIFTGTEE